MGFVGDIVKSVLPAAASFIPGVGPIAGNVLGNILSQKGEEGAEGGFDIMNLLKQAGGVVPGILAAISAGRDRGAQRDILQDQIRIGRRRNRELSPLRQAALKGAPGLLATSIPDVSGLQDRANPFRSAFNLDLGLGEGGSRTARPRSQAVGPAGPPKPKKVPRGARDPNQRDGFEIDMADLGLVLN